MKKQKYFDFDCNCKILNFYLGRSKKRPSAWRPWCSSRIKSSTSAAIGPRLPELLRAEWSSTSVRISQDPRITPAAAHVSTRSPYQNLLSPDATKETRSKKLPRQALTTRKYSELEISLSTKNQSRSAKVRISIF